MKKVIDKKTMSYEYIKERIIKNIDGPGDIVDEKKISLTLNISRTPVRESILKLMQEGFIENVRSRGFLVSEITAQYIQESFQLRFIIECGTVREVLPFVNRDKLNEIKNNFIASGNPSNNDSDIYFMSRDKIHFCIFEMMNNSRLTNIYRNIQDHIIRIRNYFNNKIDKDRAVISFNEHIEIIDSLLTGDAVRAENALRNHLSRAMEFQIARIYRMI